MGNVFGWIGELAAAEPWYLEALRIAREIDDTWSILDTMNCLADGYLGLGEISKAKGLFMEGLRLAADRAPGDIWPGSSAACTGWPGRRAGGSAPPASGPLRSSILDPRAEYRSRVRRQSLAWMTKPPEPNGGPGNP